MIYKKIVSGMFVALIFAGCSQVAPEVPLNGGSNVGDSDALSSQTVTIDEDNINANGVNGGNGLNSVNNPYNSSSDGFNSLYFDFGAYSISSNMQSVLAHDIQRAKQTSAKIKIEGNCDEFGTDEYNYALGLKRAKAVKDAMVSEGINPSRIVIFSYGESNPVCNNMSDECYQRNRRVDLKLAR
jgi:peptidoglycan-associated lipoprotein